jgi:hypothetical protein
MRRHFSPTRTLSLKGGRLRVGDRVVQAQHPLSFNGDRHEEGRLMATVGTGKYTYTLIQDWAKLPPGETFAMVSAVATDSQDRRSLSLIGMETS